MDIAVLIELSTDLLLRQDLGYHDKYKSLENDLLRRLNCCEALTSNRRSAELRPEPVGSGNLDLFAATYS